MDARKAESWAMKPPVLTEEDVANEMRIFAEEKDKAHEAVAMKAAEARKAEEDSAASPGQGYGPKKKKKLLQIAGTQIIK